MQADKITDEKNGSVSIYNSRTKAYQYKWRKNNRQKYYECCRKSQTEYYQKNKDFHGEFSFSKNFMLILKIK